MAAADPFEAFKATQQVFLTWGTTKRR